MTDADLLVEFVKAFDLLDDMLLFEKVPSELQGESVAGKYGRLQKWKPAFIRTDPASLAEVYERLPGTFPPLYEQLVISYRWLEVDLEPIVRLLANAPANSLNPLMKQITLDPILTDVLLPKGFIPFGKAPGGCYDPICFDTSRRDTTGDCPIIQFEHEAILCYEKIGETWEVAPSFRRLVEMVIARANEKPPN
jgi:hypothetical protein